jgi:uncharacterized protein
MTDFDRSILNQTAHRPWPMPSGAWVMTQTWNDLLFAHWPVDAEVLRERIPAGFDIDCFNGQAWIGVVPFHMTNVSPRFVPSLPGVSAFPELNVRTYVRVGDKPGVYFFSLDAGNSLAVAAARRLLNLPYYVAEMAVATEGGRIAYRSRRADPAAEFSATYGGHGGAQAPRPGTIEYFLTERYCLYAVSHSDAAYRLEVHHPPWMLESADASIAVNTMAAAVGVRLPSTPPLLHFSKRQDAVCWGAKGV